MLSSGDIELRIEHISIPRNTTSGGDIEYFLRNDRGRVAHIAIRDGVHTHHIIFAGKVERIAQSAATLNRGAIFAVGREESIDFHALLNVDVDIDIRRRLCLCRGEQYAAGGGIHRIDEFHHIFVHTIGKGRHIVLQHIGDIGAGEQCHLGIDVHHIAFAAHIGGNIGKTFAKQFAIALLFGVDHLHIFPIDIQVHIHGVDIHLAIEFGRIIVSANQGKVIKRNHTFFNGNGFVGKCQLTAIDRQFHSGAISLHQSIDYGCIGGAAHLHFSGGHTTEAHKSARNKCRGFCQGELSELQIHIHIAGGSTIVERTISERHFRAIEIHHGIEACAIGLWLESQIGIQVHIAHMLSAVSEFFNRQIGVAIKVFAII